MARKTLGIRSLRASPGEDQAKTWRVAVIALSVLAIMSVHWLAPREPHLFHVVHVLFQMLLVAPAVLAAAWYGSRGALVALVFMTLLYVPHVVIQWAGNMQENINQYAALATVWFTAVLAGVLMDREKAALRKLAQTHEGALIALVNALDAREHNTQRHSLRVRAYAMVMARALAIGKQESMVLAEAALLHDIGKIGVPDRVLLKAGPLAPEEWILMRRHPEIGGRILESVPSVAEAAEIVSAHHEKYDGSGYPKGVAGPEIPLGARVFAVVDAFDALTSDRPYHGRVSFAEAQGAILAGSGTHFDPRVVEVFLEVPVSQWEQIAAAFAGEGNLAVTSCDELFPQKAQ